MRVIGLCGRSGSGKSVFCRVAVENDFYVVDCDELYHQITSKRTNCLTELEKRFGSEIIVNDSLDRKTLAKIVFSDKSKLKELNSVTHKYIITEIGNVLKNINKKDENAFVLLDAPTLFESGAQFYCDYIVVITAPEDDCVSRIISRDNITESQAKARLSNQLSNDFLISRSHYHIENDSTLEDFIKDCQTLINIIKEAG